MVVGLVLMLCCLGPVTGESFTVDKSYDSVDTLLSTESWNEYKITADSDKKIEYSFEVQGSGTIMVFLIQGHSVSLESGYYVIYSKDDSTRSYSNTFPVGSDDGTKFSIAIITDESENVTYHATIKVVETPVTDYLCGVLIFIVIIIVIAAIGVLIRSRRKRRIEYKPPQQPQYPPPGTSQPPPQQPQSPPPADYQPPPQQPPPPPPPTK